MWVQRLQLQQLPQSEEHTLNQQRLFVRPIIGMGFGNILKQPEQTPDLRRLAVDDLLREIGERFLGEKVNADVFGGGAGDIGADAMSTGGG